MKKGRRTQLLMEFIESNTNITVLDIGNLGDGGEIHEYLIEKLGPSNVYGLDIINQEKRGKDYENQFIGAAEDMPFKDQMFDLVYIGEVIEHTWHPLEMIQESRRVLRAGGHLIVDTPNIYSLSRMMRYLVRGKDYILGEPTHKIFFSHAVLENLFDEAGFDIQVITTDNKFTMFGKTFVLLPIGTLNSMGEHLLCKVQVRKDAQ